MQERDQNGQPKMVSFSGIDGAGKSTQIHSLRTRLAQRGLRVRVVAFWDEVACLTQLRESLGHSIFKGDKGVGSPAAPINRRDKNVQSSPMTAIRLLLYFLDAIAARSVVKKLLRAEADLIIFDRFIYDELANLSLHNRANRIYVRFLMKLVPRPDLSYVLDAHPAEARARKPEYPLEFLVTNRESYSALGALIGHVKVIPPMPIEMTAETIWEEVYGLLLLASQGKRSLDDGTVTTPRASNLLYAGSCDAAVIAPRQERAHECRDL
jgi:thymidylate kinase